MSEEPSYAKRSQRHKKTTTKKQQSAIIHEPPQEKLHPNKNNKKYTKHIFTLVSILILVIIATSGYVIYSMKKEEALAKEKFEKATEQLVAGVQEEQSQSGLSSTPQKKDINENKTFIFLPDNDTLPIDNLDDSLSNLAQEQQKLIQNDTGITIAKVQVTHITDSLENYRLVASNYLWNPNTDSFEQQKEATQGDNYVSNKTGKIVTIQDLIADNASLLGIQQTIQQQILAESDNPTEIIDAVLTMPRISFDSQMTYSPDFLQIKLPENTTGVDEITLDYKDIAPFIDTSLVNPESIKDALPQLDEQKKYVALTFDDGPNNTTTPYLLDILKDNNVKATFFMLGQNVEQNEAVVKRVFDEGHEIASHSYSHPNFTTLSADEIREQIFKTDKAIFNVTGTLPRNLRPPYGAIDANSADLVGMPIIQWNVDSMDWKLKNPAKIAASVQQNVYDGSIILLHDIHDESVKSVPAIITELRQENYEFVTVDELLSQSQKPLHQYFSMHDERVVQ